MCSASALHVQCMRNACRNVYVLTHAQPACEARVSIHKLLRNSERSTLPEPSSSNSRKKAAESTCSVHACDACDLLPCSRAIYVLDALYVLYVPWTRHLPRAPTCMHMHAHATCCMPRACHTPCLAHTCTRPPRACHVHAIGTPCAAGFAWRSSCRMFILCYYAFRSCHVCKYRARHTSCHI